MPVSRKPCAIEQFRLIFLSTGYLCISAKTFFAKIAKHKNAYISKTVRDRAISTKFLTHRVSLQSSHPNFQKNFVSPNMAAILNFEFFAKNCETQKCLYLENRAR